MVLGDEAFGRWSVWEGRALVNRIGALIIEAPESSLTPSAMCVRTQWDNDYLRTRKRGPHQAPNLPAPSSWTSSLQDCEQCISVIYKVPISLWYSLIAAEKTKTLVKGWTPSFQQWYHSCGPLTLSHRIQGLSESLLSYFGEGKLGPTCWMFGVASAMAARHTAAWPGCVCTPWHKFPPQPSPP